ncbi:DUF3592 domain-containing protein [Nodosilinea nodulosa]|uniref:DUF3592 domain-containing protein n=1 Tax=Nodosilinea nodulosa TaxID=416001 RepID=UPI0002DE3456|nr:DUF3592 domain-containing protein [Nodosilinea nodulosa]
MDQSAITPSQYRIGIGAGGFIVLSGVALLVFGIGFLKQAHASSGWPVSPGTVTAVIVLSGVALLVFGIGFLKQAHASSGWPVSPGTVTAVKIVQERDSGGTRRRVYTYHYTVDYTYEVAGQTYRSDRYSLGSGSTASQRFRERSQAVEAAKLNHPKGSTVEVHYDPDHPDSAVLKAGANWGTYVPVILGMVFLPTGLMLLSLAFRKNTPSG